MKKKRSVRMNSMQLVAAGFLGTVFLGSVLLLLPACNTQPISYMDALFTSASAVCVTGLVTIVPATQFTLLGKIILLILIQFGGLGVITCMVAFFLILKQKISVRERVVIQESFNTTTLAGLVRLVIRVLKGTFVAEGIGAVCYAFQFVPEYGLVKGIGYSVFHAVSAFCNAGIDILGDQSFAKYVTNPWMNLVTMALIVVSGIGFIVWFDVAENVRLLKERKVKGTKLFSKLTLHSKVAIVTTVFLILVGTVGVFAMEYSNPETLGGLSFGQKWMAAAFHSVGTRTAGFSTIPQGALREGTMLFTCLFMFIGGSPGGTAGGVKTTTVAMLFLVCLTVIRGGEDTECFGRKISVGNIRTGLAVVVLAFSVLITGTLALAFLEPEISIIRLFYEATSAIGTVGLSADVTGLLGTGGKWVIIVMMYLGRIGPMTIALLFGKKKNVRDKIRKLPEQNIMVG